MRPSSDPARDGPPIRGRRPSPGLREARRTEIIESAYTVLTENGYERTLMSDIARHAGVGNGTIYRYFDSKRELADHVFDYAVAKAARALDIDSLTNDSEIEDGAAADLIAAIGTRLFALVDDDPAIIRVLTVESSAIDAELRWRVAGLSAAIDGALAQLFERFSGHPDADRGIWPTLGRLVVGTAGPALAMSMEGDHSADTRAEFLATMSAVAGRGLFDLAGGGHTEESGA